MLDEDVDHLGVELATAPPPGHVHRGVGAEGPMVDLHHLGQLRDPHQYRNLFAASAFRQSATVVSLEGERQRLLDIGAEADPLGQQRRRHAVGMDEPGQLPARIHEQCRHHPEPLRQGLTAGDVGEQEAKIGQPGPVHQVGVVTHGDVVTEPARVLV